jgi:hypothetical protein
VKLPKTFTLGGIEWAVKQLPHIPNAYGATHQGEAAVAILETLKRDVKEQTFCHELVHAILFSMGKTVDQHDEVFVDGFATFLHQYLKTAK